MDENSIIKKKKKNYYYHHNNQNKYYYYKKNKKKKKNLILENNAREEVKNILLFNEVKEDIPQIEKVVIPESKTIESNVQIPVIKVDELLNEVNSSSTVYDDDIDVIPVRKPKEKTKIFNKKLFSTSTLKYGVGVTVLVIALLGVSYSFFNYKREDPRQADITSGDVYIKLAENPHTITLNKIYPRTNEEARLRTDNYFDFTIKGKNTSPMKEIVYSVEVKDGENVQGKTRIDPKYIRLDLQEKINGEYTYIVEGIDLTSYSFIGVIPVNTTSELTREYRLRIWINDEIVISDSLPNASYTQAEFNNLFANYDISLTSRDQSPASPTPLP